MVDDQAPMLDAVRGMLRRNGYTSFQIARNGKEAIGILKSSKVDLVITDWNMPSMTGIELTHWIKSNPKFFLIPVLMISDEMTPDKVYYALEEGVDSFLVKPFSEQKLLESVVEAFNKLTNADEMEKKIFAMRMLMLQHDYSGALELGNEILKIKRHPRVVLMTCECLYHTKEYDKAMEMLLDSEGESRTSQGNNLLGQIYMGVGQADLGIYCLEQAVRGNPLNHDRQLDLVRAYLSAGRAAEAAKIIDSLMASDPTDLTLVNIAQVHIDRGEIKKAGLCLEKAANPIAETVHTFNNYAVALRKSGQYEASVEIYKKCLRIAPDSDIIHYNLALVQSKIGKLEDACELLSKAIDLNPENAHAKILLEKLGAQILKLVDE